MPQYMLLIYTPGASPEQMAEEGPKWATYTQELAESGEMVSGDALHPAETATTVRERDGETLISEGPAAKSDEKLAGYYVIDVPDLNAAHAWAGRMPNVGYGSIEVRPIVVFPTDDTPQP